MKTIHSLWAAHKRDNFPNDDDDNDAIVKFAKTQFYCGMRSLMMQNVVEGVNGNNIEFIKRCVLDMGNYMENVAKEHQTKIILPGG